MVVAKALKPRTVWMVPFVTGAGCLSRFTSVIAHTYALKVEVIRGSGVAEWFLGHAGGLPTEGAVPSADNVVSKHNWRPSHAPWPVWWVKRVESMAEANCIFEDIEARMVTTFDLPEPLEPHRPQHRPQDPGPG